jgi:hypothetical protein
MITLKKEVAEPRIGFLDHYGERVSGRVFAIEGHPFSKHICKHY